MPNQAKVSHEGEKVAPSTPHAILSDILPLPEPRFQGIIGTTYSDSQADVIAAPSAPAGAPNVLLILLDDVGFGQTSTFGGPAQTPTLQRLLQMHPRKNTKRCERMQRKRSNCRSVT